MGKRGFTLIEVIIVIVILGVLATLSLPAISAQLAVSRAAEAMTMFGVIKRAYVNCLDWTDNPSSCVTSAQLGVQVPAGASFQYFYDAWGGNPVAFRARSIPDGADLCMMIYRAPTIFVYFRSHPGTAGRDIYSGIVKRTGAVELMAPCTDIDIGNAF